MNRDDIFPNFVLRGGESCLSAIARWDSNFLLAKHYFSMVPLISTPVLLWSLADHHLSNIISRSCRGNPFEPIISQRKCIARRTSKNRMMRYIGDYAEAPLIGASLLVHFESEYLNMCCTGCWRKNACGAGWESGEAASATSRQARGA
jgi:hypothetical protein